MRGSSHVVFGLACAIVIDSQLHLSGIPLLSGQAPSPDLVAQKAIYYGCAAVGALTPDIDNARSTLGKRMGIISKGIQHYAGHRTLLHSLLGMAIVGAIIWLLQYAAGLALYHLGLVQTGEALGAGFAPSVWLASGPGIAFTGLMVGYFLHLVADSLTEGGVPWLWPSHERFGFPPNRHWRFRTGSMWEPVIVVLVSIIVIVAIFERVLYV